MTDGVVSDKPVYGFLLTRPSRDVTKIAPKDSSAEQISTHTSLAGRDVNHPFHKNKSHISTHTSLAGRDYWEEKSTNPTIISTHTSLAGRDG